jgi:hypothetical protein
MKKRKVRIWWEGHPEWVKYVEKNCCSKTDEQIAAHLSRRTDKYHIDAQVVKVLRNKNKWKTVPAPGVRWYSPEMEKFVRENWRLIDDPTLVRVIKEKLVSELGKKKAAEMLVNKSTVKHFRTSIGCIGDSNNIPIESDKQEVIKKYSKTHSAEQIAGIVGISGPRVRAFFRKKKWKLKAPRVVWPKAANKYIVKHYKTKSNIELAYNLNKLHPRGELKGDWKPGQVCAQLKRLGYDRTKEEVAAVRKRNVELGFSIFGYGDVSMKQGEITIRNAVRGNGETVAVLYIKEGNGFKILKQIVWEYHNGKIPKNHYVKCKDGDEMNTVITNLELVKSSEKMEAATQNLSDNYVIMNVSHYDPKLRERLKSEAGKAQLKFHKARLKFKRALKNAISNAK